MSFVEPAYLLFLPVVLVLYWALPNDRAQNVLLALASGVFYGWVHPWFLTLLHGACVVDWLAGLSMERWQGVRTGAQMCKLRRARGPVRAWRAKGPDQRGSRLGRPQIG